MKDAGPTGPNGRNPPAPLRSTLGTRSRPQATTGESVLSRWCAHGTWCRWGHGFVTAHETGG